ncbi:MAG: pyruvate, phosphate dikinase, partial [Lentisphaeraceae bacterium]|nr:pyruvate, phosphate dikinase [Lentisphaeraceae bacterium]
MSETKNVYVFGKSRTDGNANMRNTLGGKGANLAEMTSLGIPVPPGFTIPCELCNYYYENHKSLPKNIENDIADAIKLMEEQTGAVFGSIDNPLLVSVRSGARVSMPGMMDTVLNLGLNDQAVKGLARSTGNARMAYDSYRRFITMYAEVVKGLSPKIFEHAWSELKAWARVAKDTDLNADNLKLACAVFRDIYFKELGIPFPQSPQVQLMDAIKAVFESWNTERAFLYRAVEHIPNEWGTAVNVQAMVFGNRGNNSATGVAFTRNPATGENKYYGEYLVNAQGEDVVAGILTPLPISAENAAEKDCPGESLEEVLPQAYKQLTEVFDKLELHYKDMQDIEFTIDDGKLFILQTRNAKRTGFAQVKIAVDMVEEGLIDPKTALTRFEPTSIEQLLSPVFDPATKA